jgi:hypothetical protein
LMRGSIAIERSSPMKKTILQIGELAGLPPSDAPAVPGRRSKKIN